MSDNIRLAHVALGNAIASIVEAQSYGVFTNGEILKKISSVMDVSATVSKSEGSANIVKKMLNETTKKDNVVVGDKTHKAIPVLKTGSDLVAAYLSKRKNSQGNESYFSTMPLKSFRNYIKNTPNLTKKTIEDWLDAH